MRRPLRVVPTFLAINAVVFLLWKLGGVSDLDPNALGRFMIANFMISTQRLIDGRLWTLITAAFSHKDLWHLALNMIVLYSFGNLLERLLGWRQFSAFYLVAALISSLSHCFVSSVFLGRAFLPALGASGAVCGLLLVYALLFPRQRILVFGVVPVPALLGALAFVALDLWGLFAQSQGGGLPIGHGAHLGGAACGALFYVAVLKPRLEERARARAAAGGGAGSGLGVAVTMEEAAELERLKDKVHRDGPASLNPKERDFLARIKARAEGRE
jgi:membrane associated rhomboid family serine protease